MNNLRAILGEAKLALLTAILVAITALAEAEPVSLAGATFGYQRTIPLHSTIGRMAIPSSRIIRAVGGVAFVREAIGADGWAVQNMVYDTAAVDGKRLAVTLTRNSETIVEVRPEIWDWELVPLARFVASPYDSAFTFFGELQEGISPTINNARIVSYHPSLKDTLLGLRLMQLDLFLFQEPFAGFFTNAKGVVILGAGERSALGVSPADKAAVGLERDKIRHRVEDGMSLLTEDCKHHLSRTCRDAFQPFSSYIVGDMISPTKFSVANGRLSFRDQGICWDFSRETDPGEKSTEGLEGVVLLRPLSEAFCKKVREDLSGMHPLVYRAANRAMRYSALMRHYESRDQDGFKRFVKSMAAVSPNPRVDTPTEIAIEGNLSDEDMNRILEQLRQLENGRRR